MAVPGTSLLARFTVDAAYGKIAELEKRKLHIYKVGGRHWDYKVYEAYKKNKKAKVMSQEIKSNNNMEQNKNKIYHLQS